MAAAGASVKAHFRDLSHSIQPAVRQTMATMMMTVSETLTGPAPALGANRSPWGRGSLR